MNGELRTLVLETIVESPWNPRKHFDKSKMAELERSIERSGVLTPLLVRPIGNAGDGTPLYFELAAGHRRFRAAKAVRRVDAPVIVRHMDDQEFLEVLTIENAQREDVHPLDEAEGYRAILDHGQYDVATLAERVGKDESFVYKRLKLASLVPAAKQLFLDDVITVSHATILGRLPAEAQQRAIARPKNTESGLYTWQGEVKTPRELQAWVERNVYLELSKVPWDVDDAQLVAAAGSCTACPKRSGAAPSLFPEVGKKEMCLEVRCFDAKRQAFVARRVAELKSEHPNIVQIQRGYNHAKPKAGEALAQGQYFRVKKGTAGAKLAVVVAGHGRDLNDVGKTEWITTERPKERDRETPENRRWQQAEARRQKEQKARAAIRRAQFAAVTDKLPKQLTDVALVRAMVAWAVEELHNETLRALCAVLGLEAKRTPGSIDFAGAVRARSRGLDIGGNVQLLAQVLVAADLTSYSMGKSRLAAAAKVLKVRLPLKAAKVKAAKKPNAKRARAS